VLNIYPFFLLTSSPIVSYILIICFLISRLFYTFLNIRNSN